MSKIAIKHEQFGSTSVRLSWTGLRAGDECEESLYPTFSDRSVQVHGDFSGATVRLDGSNDGEHFFPLTNLRGNTLSMSSGGIEQIEDCSYALRPVVVGGDEFTNITITVFARKGV